MENPIHIFAELRQEEERQQLLYGSRDKPASVPYCTSRQDGLPLDPAQISSVLLPRDSLLPQALASNDLYELQLREQEHRREGVIRPQFKEPPASTTPSVPELLSAVASEDSLHFGSFSSPVCFSLPLSLYLRRDVSAHTHGDFTTLHPCLPFSSYYVQEPLTRGHADSLFIFNPNENAAIRVRLDCVTTGIFSLVGTVF